MIILFDHGTPRSIARFLRGHTVVEAVARGWDRLDNGALLKAQDLSRDPRYIGNWLTAPGGHQREGPAYVR